MLRKIAAFCLSAMVAATSFAQDSIQAVPPTPFRLLPPPQLWAADTAQEPIIELAAPVADSTPRPPIVSKPLSFRSIAIPTAMIAYGAFTLGNKNLKDLNLTIREKVGLDGNRRHLPMDDFTIVVPALAVYGLNLAGVKGKHNLVDRTALYGMSYLIGSGIVGATKRLTDVVRPDSSNTLSFPSGHTAQAFIAAEFLRQEYKDRSPWYGIAGYAVAAGTGFLRMYNNKHWLNDVIAGAGIGIISTRVSYWLYPKIKRVFFKDKPVHTVVMPYYQNRTFGLGLVRNF